MVNWSKRKLEIGAAFRQATPLPAETDEAAYNALLERIGVTTDQDKRVLISLVQDIIMQARREERPTTPLDTFLDWLEYARYYN